MVVSARIGLIIPSSNRMVEQEMVRFAPAGVQMHIARLRMTSVSSVNQLYGGEDAKRRDRVKARFVNNGMMATLLGAVVSDALENGQVVSGVGGQFNFVAQAFALALDKRLLRLGIER